MSDRIDWKRVGERLRCPLCGDKAFIEQGSDGTEGVHMHRFTITREMARELSQPTPQEAAERIPRLEEELRALRAIVDPTTPKDLRE